MYLLYIGTYVHSSCLMIWKFSINFYVISCYHCISITVSIERIRKSRWKISFFNKQCAIAATTTTKMKRKCKIFHFFFHFQNIMSVYVWREKKWIEKENLWIIFLGCNNIYVFMYPMYKKLLLSTLEEKTILKY